MGQDSMRQLMELNLHQAPRDHMMKALIIYDNFAFAAKATELLQRVAHQADVSMHWNLRLWRLDTLNLPHRADEALAEAADAHVVVFAGHRTQLLPCWLLNWLERWVPCHEVADAAFAVIGGRSGDELIMPAAVELSQFARRHGFNFIVEGGLVEKCEAEFSTRNTPETEMALDLVTLDGRTTDNFYRGSDVVAYATHRISQVTENPI
jgi:hypothetical protein